MTTHNDEATTQEWTNTKTFDDSQTAEETVAFGEGLDDFDLDGGSQEPKHAKMPVRGEQDDGGGEGFFGRFMAWLKGVFGGGGS